MKNISKLVLSLILFLGLNSLAQNDSPGGKLGYVGHSSSMRVAPSMMSRSSQTIPASEWDGVEPMDGRHSIRGARATVVPGKDPQTENDPLAANPGKLDKALRLNRALENDFVVNNSVGSPSDPALAVGPDHVFVVFNRGYIIYDKEGTALTGPMSPDNIFSPGGCCDLTVTYDNNADRWVLTYLYTPIGVELAISSGPDPLTSTWTVYTFPLIDDYNKLSRWRDGYYITDNGDFDVWVIDREAVLNGDPEANVQAFNIEGVEGQLFTSAQVANIIDDKMPETGGAPLVYMRDDGFETADMDAINIWTLDIDFDEPENSTISAPQVFSAPDDITPFINVFDGGTIDNLAQPNNGTNIDAIQSAIMNQMHFRKFPTHNSLLFNFVIDTDASEEGELAGIRWYEFRQAEDAGPWSLEQEGTYIAPDGRHAWMGSMAMDNQGNIGMGYSSMAGPTTPNPSQFPVGAYFTGQLGNAGSGVMNVAEQFIGSNGNVSNIRYGDYAKVDVDPSNDKEFWFITEYNRTNHIAVFQIQPDANDDVGVVFIDTPEDGDLSVLQEVTVTIMNFGLDPASGFDVTYSIDDITITTEPFMGVIAPGETASFTFTTLGDFSVVGQTYELTAATIFTDDETNQNNAATKDVTHLYPNDVGAISLTASISEVSQVTIEIQNFGSATQTSIPIFYTLDGNTVQETYTGSLAQGEIDTYTFSTTADTSELGDYVFVTGTELIGDQDEVNDDITVTVTNMFCEPEGVCAPNGAISNLSIADQTIDTECGPNGYANNTDIVFNFVLADNPFEGTLQTGLGNSAYSIWIDFNRNSEFEEDEIVAEGISNSAPSSDTNFTINFASLDDEIAVGSYVMRVRATNENLGGDDDASDPCGDLQLGRTNDYTANISGVLGNDDELFTSTDLQIYSLGNDQFEVIFNDTSSFSDTLPITVYNTSGQTLAYYTVEANGGGYSKRIDMSFVSSGVYFVKVGTEQLNKVKRVVVE